MAIGIKVKPIVHIKVIKEALSRIGIANKDTKTLYPSCYLTVINDEFVIVHFKELFPILNNGDNYMNDQDINRRNTIISLLYNWKLIDIDYELNNSDKYVFVLKCNQKDSWIIYHKINLNILNKLEENGIYI